jgi:hypothetical protein
MDQVKILDIKWMDDEKREAILLLSTGSHFVQVFCHPCTFQIGDTIVLPLQSLDDETIVRVDGGQYGIINHGDSFESSITARVEDAKAGIVSVGPIKIQLGADLPGDIVNGETISFISSRLQARKS